MAQRVAYFGPAGTFTEQAALLYQPDAELVPFTTIAGVVQAVEAGQAALGVVPIENSIEGTVSGTVDALIHESDLAIRDEVVLPIEHHLMARPGASVDSIEIVYSHPQSLGQCRHFLERRFPSAQLVASLSNATAVEDALKSERPAAAIGPRRAAELYGAEILASNIQDSQHNETRFVVLAHADRPPTGDDKTSVCFALADDDKPGTLVNVLKEFAERSISMTKIESRPSKQLLGKYIFLVDLEGHRDNPVVAECLAQVKRKSTLYKLFGSYPRCRAAAVAAPPRA